MALKLGKLRNPSESLRSSERYQSTRPDLISLSAEASRFRSSCGTGCGSFYYPLGNTFNAIELNLSNIESIVLNIIPHNYVTDDFKYCLLSYVRCLKDQGRSSFKETIIVVFQNSIRKL
ncbi:hypothetical protein V1478_002944 [Vespula squamosa]|uniref:Uncharacterized protein n=1 Tax=Vespula squamosa TaxID=30214 RepID=A0ABD2BRA2_VESSQ